MSLASEVFSDERSHSLARTRFEEVDHIRTISCLVLSDPCYRRLPGAESEEYGPISNIIGSFPKTPFDRTNSVRCPANLSQPELVARDCCEIANLRVEGYYIERSHKSSGNKMSLLIMDGHPAQRPFRESPRPEPIPQSRRHRRPRLRIEC
jgi:hypothetical protein